MIYKETDPTKLRIDARELRARLSSPGGLEGAVAERLYGELLSVAKPAYVATRVELSRQNGGIALGRIVSRSEALARLTDGCSAGVALVCTLGVGVDRLILKRAQISPAEAFILDALADAMVEALCDLAESETCDLGASPRFSPGYADIELSLGKEIIALTSAEKLLGIRFTESGLMIPKKSVNALVAIKDV